MIAHAKGRVRAQASYGNITVLSHLNAKNFFSEGRKNLVNSENKENLS